MNKIQHTRKEILEKLDLMNHTHCYVNIIFLINGDITAGLLFKDRVITYYNDINQFLTDTPHIYSQAELDESIIILEEVDSFNDKTKIYKHIKENYIEYFV